jgi:hypothetical protein
MDPDRRAAVLTGVLFSVGTVAGSVSLIVTQPAFLAVYGHDLEVTPVPEPLRLMPFRTMLDAGVSLAFSSDHPAVPLGPFTGVHAAVTRRDHTGTALRPEEALTVAEALTAYTSAAARARPPGGGCARTGLRRGPDLVRPGPARRPGPGTARRHRSGDLAGRAAGLLAIPGRRRGRADPADRRPVVLTDAAT